MSDRAFVNTNILVYAHDADAGEKHTIAAKTMAGLWESRGASSAPRCFRNYM